MEDALCCRICLEEGERREFIAPCSCSGSQKWVHRACLDRWRSIREDKAFSRCTECLKPYEMVSRLGDDDSMITARRCRFACLIARDFSLALIVSQMIIISLALIVFAFDAHSHIMIQSLRQTAHPVTFYYLMGLFIGLATLGLAFTLMNIGCCVGDDGCSSGGCQCYDAGFYPCIYTSPHSTSVCAADCCGCNAECCACCAQQDAVGCGECASAGAAGEECVIVLIVVVVLFALVGAVVCVVLGVAYAQSIIRKHYHVLQKYTLATDFIVADLAEGALPMPSNRRIATHDEESYSNNYNNDDDSGDDVELGQGMLGRGSGTIVSGLFQRANLRGRDSPLNGRTSYSYSRAPTSMSMGESGEGLGNGNVFGDVELGSYVPLSSSSPSPLSAHPAIPAISAIPSAPPLSPQCAARITSPIHSVAAIHRDIRSSSSSNNNNNNIDDDVTGGDVVVETGAVDPYVGASAPYDPHLHHFSRRQYQDLVGRGLL